MPISPNQGSTGGGTTVTITGTNLSGTTAVKFGSKSATSVTQVSPTQVT
ncbi:IPT/TIG domain-containing protein, partial [Streptomyces phyllanthi]